MISMHLPLFSGSDCSQGCVLPEEQPTQSLGTASFASTVSLLSSGTVESKPVGNTPQGVTPQLESSRFLPAQHIESCGVLVCGACCQGACRARTLRSLHLQVL